MLLIFTFENIYFICVIDKDLSQCAIENKIPQGSGIKNDEGNVIGYPMKHQYNKSLVSSGNRCIVPLNFY